MKNVFFNVFDENRFHLKHTDRKIGSQMPFSNVGSFVVGRLEIVLPHRISDKFRENNTQDKSLIAMILFNNFMNLSIFFIQEAKRLVVIVIKIHFGIRKYRYA